MYKKSLNPEFKIQNSKLAPRWRKLAACAQFKIQNSKFKIQNSKFLKPSAKDERRFSEG